MKKKKLTDNTRIILLVLLFAFLLYGCQEIPVADKQPTGQQEHIPTATAVPTNTVSPMEALPTATPTVTPTPSERMLIAGIDEWNSYVVDGALQLPEEKTWLTVSGEWNLPETVVTKPLTIEFHGAVTIAKDITFSFMEKGTVTLLTGDNAVPLTQHLQFQTPAANVNWEGEDAPAFELVEQYHNVASYNGQETDTWLGGQGTNRVLSGKIGAANVTLDGNYLHVTDTYAKPLALDKAKLSLKMTEEGKVALHKEQGNYYCVVTDADGKEFGYRLIVTTKKHSLPIVYLTTDSGKSELSRDSYVSGQFTIDYNGSVSYANIRKATVQLRGRGNSTWKLDKKPYKIKFETKTSLFGLTEAKEWVLLANHLDRTFLRNTVAFSMAEVADCFLFVPSSYPVDLYLNGVYQGVYCLGEQIEVKNGRIPGTAMKNSTEVDTDYLLEWGGDKKATTFGSSRFSTTLQHYVQIKYPSEEILTKEQYDYIRTYIQAADDAVMALSGYEEYIDIPSLIDWFLVQEFTYNIDGIFRRSDFFLKKQGGKLYAAAPWDFDYAFGNFNLSTDHCQEWICLGNAKTDAYEGRYIQDNWITYLLEDPVFQKQLKERWEEIGEEMYQAAVDTIATWEPKIAPSAEENFTVWNNCLGVKLQYESRNVWPLDTYEEHVDFLRSWIKKRYRWMDKTIRAM